MNKLSAFAQKYWKELGTKSPFFRAWFGDWRENDITPVAVADIGNGLEVLKLYVQELYNVNSVDTTKRTYMLQNITKQSGSSGSRILC